MEDTPSNRRLATNRRSRSPTLHTPQTSCYHYPPPQMNECSTRQSLDQAMCTDLDLDPETVATIRRHLTGEPPITTKRYAG